MRFQRKPFFDGYRKAFGSLRQLQVDALEFLLGKIEQDDKWESLPQIAYLLATIKHETGVSRNNVDQTFQPIRELRAKAGTKGRANQDRYWLSGYYGRGLVQITWKENYAKFGIAHNPDKALEPETAYTIASRGMREGKFTKYKLSDFINFNEVDYHNARRVVNGLDRAELIAGYAQKFERILKASLVTNSVTEPAAAELVKDLETQPAEIKAAEVSVQEPTPDSVVPQTPQAEETKEDKVTVQKVAQSLGSKLMAGSALVGSIGSALLGAFLGIIRNPYAFAIIIVGGAFIAVYAWNKSKDRQAMLQMDLNAKAASKDLNTVVIVPPPPKSG